MVDEPRIAVVGGGVAGCATAIALGRAKFANVVLLEATSAGRLRVGETIPPDSRRLLRMLGLEAGFDAEKHAPCYGSASSWGNEELGFNDHFVHPLAHGWHLDRQRFDAWLAQQARHAGAECISGARIMDVRRCDDHFQIDVTYEDEMPRQTFPADFVVDATGVKAWVGRRLGSRRLDHDRLVYVAGSFEPDASDIPSGQTWLEATQDGWWYAAQLPSGMWTVAMATDPETVRERRLHNAANWKTALESTRHLQARLGHLVWHDEEPTVWNVHSSLLGPPAGPGWLAVGDAAATYDPISARGIHKALEDGLRAAVAIRNACQGNDDAIGAFARHTILAFRSYLEQRALLYARESRWPEAQFWKRRLARRNLVVTPRGFPPASENT